jgi:hypothetical protein
VSILTMQSGNVILEWPAAAVLTVAVAWVLVRPRAFPRAQLTCAQLGLYQVILPGAQRPVTARSRGRYGASGSGPECSASTTVRSEK